MSDLALQPILVLLSQSAGRNPSQYMLEQTFGRHDLDWRYLSVEVTEEALEDAVRGIRAMGFAGGNCARPHNRRIGRFLDRLGTTAERAGTVNMIRRQDDGLVGENTEGRGIVGAVEAVRQTPARRVMLFGSGDTGRAAAVELAEAGTSEIVVVSRTEERALALVQLLNEHYEMAVRWLAWDNAAEAPAEIDLVINATPVGTAALEGSPPVDWALLSPDATVVDANLEETVPPLLHAAAERGLTTVNGLDVFLEQAAANFRLWTGLDPERTVMREAVEEYLEL
ncbi:MAG: shikimate dehydrogenase family protein [Thermoguttaceae bacterium]